MANKEHELLEVLKKKFSGNNIGIFCCYSIMLDHSKMKPTDLIFQELAQKTETSSFFSGAALISKHVHKVNKGILLYNNKFQIYTFEHELPEALYLICFSPLKDEKEKSVIEAKTEIQTQVGLLRLIYGNGIAKELIFECLLDLNTGEKKDLDLVMMLHKEFEGPFNNESVFEHYNEVKKQIIHTDMQIKMQIVKALQLIEEAATCKYSQYKFILYFLSIEALFGECWKVGAFIVKIAEHYNCSKSFVKNKLMFREIWNMRIDAFHRGKMFLVNQEFERYLQLLILDLIRAFLKLPCKRLAEEYLKKYKLNLDYNIVPIDIDNIIKG